MPMVINSDIQHTRVIIKIYTFSCSYFGDVKIEYTELKLSCGNDPVVKYSIYSNGDLDIMTPK
jgi:hypothetical protein